jgi:hypothetical protein
VLASGLQPNVLLTGVVEAGGEYSNHKEVDQHRQEQGHSGLQTHIGQCIPFC